MRKIRIFDNMIALTLCARQFRRAFVSFFLLLAAVRLSCLCVGGIPLLFGVKTTVLFAHL